MQDQLQRLPGLAADFNSRQFSLQKSFKSFIFSFTEIDETVYDAAFHFFCCLIRKGGGENVPVFFRLFKNNTQVFFHQRKRFPRPGR